MPDLNSLALAVLQAKRKYEFCCLRNISGKTDEELVEYTIDRQRAVQALVTAEGALADAVRRESV